MLLDYGIFPPEFNSIRIYTGLGSGPMLAASAAWDQIAIELASAAASYQGVVSGLVAGWQGPSAAQMELAAIPYVTWMHTTAAQAEQVANQARAAAVAFEAAHAATVPPPVIAANRSLLMSLVATNWLGQNTPAIATTEAHYMTMWAQCAGAMYGYAGAATQAMVLPENVPPKPNTNPLGLANQGAALSNAGTQAGVSNAQSVVSQVTTALPHAVQTTAQNVASGGVTLPTDALTKSVTPYLSLVSSPASMASSGVSVTNSLSGIARGLFSSTSAASSGLTAATQGVTGAGTGIGALGSAGTAGLNATASMGRAVSLGGLSAPQLWGAAAQTVGSPAAVLPTPANLASAVQTAPSNMFGGVPLASLGSRAANNGMAASGAAVRPELTSMMLRPVVGG